MLGAGRNAGLLTGAPVNRHTIKEGVKCRQPAARSNVVRRVACKRAAETSCQNTLATGEHAALQQEGLGCTRAEELQQKQRRRRNAECVQNAATLRLVV